MAWWRPQCAVAGAAARLQSGSHFCCDAGIIGAGTNNARLAGLLRQLSAYYHKEPVLLFLVRVAQGLVHMGKGLLTLAPSHAHSQLLNGAPHAPFSRRPFPCPRPRPPSGHNSS